MAFPAQVFYSIHEVSVRWGCSVTQVVNNAIADELDLVTGVSHVMFGEESGAGLISVPGCQVRPLFPPFGKAAKKIHITHARLSPNDPWRAITEPAGGVRLTAADIMVTAKEIDRFEEEHGIGRTRSVGPGAPLKYDWDGFYIAVLNAFMPMASRPGSAILWWKCRSGSSRTLPRVMRRTKAQFAAGFRQSGRS
jgi:hypothetical protein